MPQTGKSLELFPVCFLAADFICAAGPHESDTLVFAESGSREIYSPSADAAASSHEAWQVKA
jgi:hypothetical protein